MARFLTVFKPAGSPSAASLIEALQPLLRDLHAEVDHRTPAHLSALMRGWQEQLRMQLFADVQSKAEGPVLELVLMSREPMGQGAPQTLAVFQRLIQLVADGVPALELRFRSDRDGALPA